MDVYICNAWSARGEKTELRGGKREERKKGGEKTQLGVYQTPSAQDAGYGATGAERGGDEIRAEDVA